MFFNFSGKDFTTAMNDGDLFGIRFAETNDSQVSRTGVYQNVTAMSVTQDNDGYDSLKQYYNHSKFDKINTKGTDLPNKADAYDYLYGSTIAQKPTKNNTPILNVIQSGRFLGDIDLLDGTQLSNAGLDFSHFEANDSHTYGFTPSPIRRLAAIFVIASLVISSQELKFLANSLSRLKPTNGLSHRKKDKASSGFPT